MLTQRTNRYHKLKIIGGSFLKSVYDKVKNVISSSSKILNRIPTGVKTQIKNIATPLLKTAVKKAIEPVKNVIQPTLKKIPTLEKMTPSLNDRSRAILSNLIAGSGFKNYIQ